MKRSTDRILTTHAGSLSRPANLIAMSKAIVHAAFPDHARWLPINPPLGELRWADGVHLDERSALLVVRAIESALAERGR